jgi:hypothetical protein
MIASGIGEHDNDLALKVSSVQKIKSELDRSFDLVEMMITSILSLSNVSAPSRHRINVSIRSGIASEDFALSASDDLPWFFK